RCSLRAARTLPREFKQLTTTISHARPSSRPAVDRQTIPELRFKINAAVKVAVTSCSLERTYGSCCDRPAFSPAVSRHEGVANKKAGQKPRFLALSMSRRRYIRGRHHLTV
ncbi:MAG: hypothetical protein AB7G39_18920, partial [Alphaproteobacteria bacterium]